MNLLLFLLCNFIGLNAFVAYTVISMLIGIIASFLPLGFMDSDGEKEGVVVAIPSAIGGAISIIAFIVFIATGFPILPILIFFLVLSILVSAASIFAAVVFESVGLSVVVNVVQSICNIIGLILFNVCLL